MKPGDRVTHKDYPGHQGTVEALTRDGCAWVIWDEPLRSSNPIAYFEAARLAVVERVRQETRA